MSKIVFEIAKNGLETCKFETEPGTYKYMYSKYAPERVKKEDIQAQTKALMLVGGGLGYEYAMYRQQFTGNIYVLELSAVLREKLVAMYPDIRFVDEALYVQLSTEQGIQVIEHKHIIELYLPQYLRLKTKIGRNRKIAVMRHQSIQKDCSRAFEKLGYEPIEIEWDVLTVMKANIAEISPLFMFTINFSPSIAAIAKQLEIPYVSWTVDTPAYTLHNEANYHEYTYTFIYDEEVVKRLRASGINNVYYLPVAAPVERYAGIQLDEQELAKYSCDVSFLGSRCANNEWMNVFQTRLTASMNEKFNEIAQKQCFSNENVIAQLMTTEIIASFEQETGYSLFKQEEALLNKEQRLIYLLGRYHSYIERTALLKELQSFGKVHIYGEESWGQDFPSSIYKGFIENDIEMPKVFKASKININNIRSFVESGLPQRVFDVLGCQGFLISNENTDLTRYFKDGRDLVIYRDLQDLKEQVAYYLAHEQERLEIARNGYENVLHNHCFEQRLKQILEIL